MKSRGPDDWGCVVMALKSRDVALEEEICWAGKSRQYPKTVSGAHVFLGHRRLAIIDLSAAGQQPMESKTESIWISYNGEVYNYLELRDELRELGHTFVTETDTEVVLAGYQEWGENCFKRFNGMWGLAVVDLKRGILLLSRDRFGIKPLYYCHNMGALYFASEIKALLAVSDLERLASDWVVRDFLLYGVSVFGEETFFRGVKQVPAGATMCVELDRPDKFSKSKRWWRLTPLSVPRKSAVETWREILRDAVRIRLRSDVRVGSCLSGGIDSSAIVATAAEFFKGDGDDFHTITSCYDEKENDERDYAETVVKYVGTAPTWVYPARDSHLADDLFELARVQEQPFPSLSIYSQYCVMRAAKQAGLKVLLDGQGGDELFLGYDSSQAMKIVFMLRQGRVNKAFREAVSLNRNSAGLHMSRLLAMVLYYGVPQLRLYRNRKRVGTVLDQALLGRRKASFAKLTCRDRNLYDVRKRWVEDHPLPALLHYEDRNSMAHSIETRLPFLDYRMVNLAFGLSEEVISGKGWSKLLSRLAMDGAIPENVIWRKDKKGFPAPTSEFMRRILPMLDEMFTHSPRSKRFLKAPAVLQELAKPESPEWLFRAVSLEVWMRVMAVN